MLNQNLIAVTDAKSKEKQCVIGKGYRITVLTPLLVRTETNPDNIFLDKATQSVWFRDFNHPLFSTKEDKRELLIITEEATFYFSKKSRSITHVQFKGAAKKIRCNNRHNLKGTARTLDFTFGPIPLQKGIMSKKGVAVLDDSKSLVLDDDGMVRPREHRNSDHYIFAYGSDYRRCLQDFFKLCGRAPLIPRYTLGNWWSRYRAYSQEEYTSLMKKFIKEEIPITVATIDMDWHWVKVNEKFGTNYKGRFSQGPGWTGYSWNTDLFPDYKAFLRWLQDQNLKITVNLHPAAGVRHFEDMYEEMAQELGVDPRNKADIAFDITDPKFISAYFKILHHPYEDDGVDFWWIDWQQGKKTALQGLDPLWSLNHYHYLDSMKGKRPLILSRYAGVGSHRYPLGFSGDTAMNWSVFKFQPYFTATASNIGYTWWSHDIGGHHFGVKNDELYIRWVQFGVFSPIMRLHSTSNDLLGKEPWNYRKEVELFTKEQLQLRHRLIPYLYTMNYRTYAEGLPLIEPMYYNHPQQKEAYSVANQYYFGSELIVCPITRKMDKKLSMAFVDAWLPKGRWTDIFTGTVYRGEQKIRMYRGLESIPVLAKEGAILPLSENEGNSWGNPSVMTLWVYRGSSSFTLYEDNGEDNRYLDGEYALTTFTVAERDALKFTIDQAAGDVRVLPEKRRYLINFSDIKNASSIIVTVNEQPADSPITTDECLKISLDNIKPTDRVEIEIRDYSVKENPPLNDIYVKLFTRYQGSNQLKMWQYKKLIRVSAEQRRKALSKAPLRRILKEAIREYL